MIVPVKYSQVPQLRNISPGIAGRYFWDPTRMSTLSRREEETLFKTTKAHALKECDPLVKGMFSVTCLNRRRHPLCSIRRVCCWTYSFGCLGLQGEVQCCSGLRLPIVSVIFFIHLINLYAPSTRPESMQLVRDEYLRIRNEQQEQLPS